MKVYWFNIKNRKDCKSITNVEVLKWWIKTKSSKNQQEWLIWKKKTKKKQETLTQACVCIVSISVRVVILSHSLSFALRFILECSLLLFSPMLSHSYYFVSFLYYLLFVFSWFVALTTLFLLSLSGSHRWQIVDQFVFCSWLHSQDFVAKLLHYLLTASPCVTVCQFPI